MSLILKPFSKVEDPARERAASEARPIDIPFQHPIYLTAEYSGGKTDKCFFLRAKTTGAIYPYNREMAESGNVMYMPHFDLELLRSPEYAGEVAVWRYQGMLPKGYDEAPKATATKASTPTNKKLTTVSPTLVDSLAPNKNDATNLA